MRAVGFSTSLPIDAPGALEDIEVDKPSPGPQDVLVSVQAVSVNPVDTKVRMRGGPASGHTILGYDACGIVEAVGSQVTRFAPGDAVFYAGDVTRQGTNAAFHTVDARIAGRKPATLSHSEAAALPLTAITAWELLFDSFKLTEGAGDGDALLIIGGAGGVGSIMIQLAKQLTGLTVIATASRDETREWCARMGADHIVDHRQPLNEELARVGIAPRYVAALTATDQHFDAIIDAIKPRGEIGMIDDPQGLDIMKIKRKALSFHIEFMFARPVFQMEDIGVQGALLDQVSALVDAGKIVTTATQNLGPMSATTLIEAHRQQESGRVIGKTVLDGFAD
ncbi:MAG: zinc-binding alcohol dehydrogenase family protein [Pseudomonadota bacterium]